MDDQYENVSLADLDVVRSTQFVDELRHQVRTSTLLWPLMLLMCIVHTSLHEASVIELVKMNGCRNCILNQPLFLNVDDRV